MLLSKYTICNCLYEIFIFFFLVEVVQKEVSDVLAFKFDEAFVNWDEIQEIKEVCGLQRIHLEGNNPDDVYKIVELVIHML